MSSNQPKKAPMSEVAASEKHLLHEWIHWIMGGLVVWGLLLGLGAYLYFPGGPTPRSSAEEQKAILRGIIVATCAVAFVTFWWVMLWTRERRMGRGKKS
jgi:hypothetical protein